MSTQVLRFKEEILEEAQKEKQKIEQATAEKILGIEKAAEAEIQRIKSAIEDSGRSKAETEAKRLLGKARLEEKMKYLAAKEKALKEVFAEGTEQLKSFTESADYVKVLQNLITTAGVALEGGNLSVELRKEDQSKVNLDSVASEITSKTGLQTKITLAGEPKTKLGGVIVRKEDMWVDNTFEALIARRNEALRAGISKILFS